MSILSKIKAEAKRVENRAKKEADRVIARVEKKVDAEAGRVERKYSPVEAFKGIDTGTLILRLKLVLVKSLTEALETTTQWAAEEIVASESKLDDMVLPILEIAEAKGKELIGKISEPSK